MRRDGEKCRYCGTTESLTLDHIVPRSKGGRNAICNLQILCLACNAAKGDTVNEDDMIPGRMRRVSQAATAVRKKAPKVRSSLHLPACDASYCEPGCPVRR